ncbi:HEAT repeat-containing protein 5B-like protein [Dinothrombium tinctorium]|uniref:HEAT repeat-containing protein 5B-like protein n=1 Tax=Dinothrombium tinctorium TaxID=1965070 RepID=A0A3S4RM95_9ACAR|nr:HEAT repeat-containing protein 5B-like protein [Dinothrombium tinctorium]RWS17933.1 HEAT repeat-containing protein 5B-like protein [Dinothrombium tinctorium]
MDKFHSLTLNEEALSRVSESKRAICVLEWLRYLNLALSDIQNSQIKECQKQIVEQLMKQIQSNCGPPTRKLVGRCLATLFSVGDTFLLFDTVNKCNDILKNKDDSPSFLPIKLAAITCVGIMYESLGRLMGRSYEDTVSILLKSLKNAESQLRCEIYLTLKMIIVGMGTAASALHRDIFKAVRHGMTDRVLAVRCNAALCLQEMLKFAPFLYTTDLETVFSLCFRAFDGSNYDVRCAVSQVLGTLVAVTQQASKAAVGKNRLASLEEVLGLMATGFLRGGIGFLKSGAGEMIKGSIVSRETRVGVSHAYVILASKLGSMWLEKHLSLFISHLLDLVGNPKAAPTHMDAVYSRRCITFVLRTVLGKQLGEKTQGQAVKELINIINRQLHAGSISVESGNENSNNANNVAKESIDPNLVQHVLICALQEIGCLIEDLGTSSLSVLSDSSVGVIDAVASVLINPSPAARISAAWCLRCIAVACPLQLTPLIERCLERLETMKTSPETIYGYSYALSALLGSACQTPLSIPHSKGKLIFSIAEDLLRSSSQNSRLSLQRTQSGWQLIGSVMTLGPSVVRGLLPRMLLLWKNSFPRSSKELESEKARGDAFTWQITLENRAGALAAMSSFLIHCEKLATDEVIRRLLTPVESAITMLTSLNSVFRNYGPSVKASSAMVRLRLYETLLLLPPQSFDNSYTGLLRLLVAEFTLAENAANTTTSLLRTFCHLDDDIILGSWVQETDHKSIEDQMEPNRKLLKDFLQPNSVSGSGALEHDITSLYKPPKEDEFCPWPLPLGVSVIDKSCLVFAHIYRFVATKHKLQMFSHFQECIKHAKAARQEAVQINILTSLLGAFKSLAENKTTLGSDDIKNSLKMLLFSMLSHSNPFIRCAASQALGRAGQVAGDGKYVAELAQTCFDKLKSARDALTRTGHSLALGYLHRYVGSLGSTQHLNTSISILLALSQDSTSSLVQVWALHALNLIADSGGPMFRSYIEPTLSQALKLLITVPSHNCDVHQCIGKLLSAIITTVGPELHSSSDSICTTRSSLLLACTIMQEHGDPIVQSEAISCLQQLHLFAPKHVDLPSVVPTLCNLIRSPHLFLRRAVVSCLQQFAQCDAKEVCDHSLKWLELAKEDQSKNPLQLDYGLVGVLFSLLDMENDHRIIIEIHKTIISIVQCLVSDNLHQLLALCKEVLTAADKDIENEFDYDDDELTFKPEESTNHYYIPPRWKTRVFATKTLCRIINACETVSKAKYHFDLTLARERKTATHGKEDFLVLHLSDLIRMSFMTATSDIDSLRLEGLKALQLVIDKFSKVPEPEFPDHVILEQYQAQVGAALRPAFSPDTPSHVTAVACEVCSAWICSGVARDLNDLRRVHQLLVSSLTKLQKDSSSRLYNESASTLEKLAILKAWAEVYVVAMEQEINTKCKSKQDEEDDVYDTSKESLLQLVKPELLSLSSYWLSALKDHALLTLPPEFSSQLPHDGGAFYTSDTVELARPQYRNSWPPILHAAALWLCSQGFNVEENLEENSIYFHLLFGICMEALCNPKSSEPVSYVIVCLKSLETLFSHLFPRSIIGKDKLLSIELCNVLHRLLLTRETPFCQNLVLNVAHLVVKAQQEHIESEKKKVQKELAPANQKLDETNVALTSIGEGGDNGVITPGQSVIYALMEVCLCILVRQLPKLSPTLANTPGINFLVQKQTSNGMSEESANLIGKALTVLCELPELCSPSGSVVILPSVLYLITGVLKEAWIYDDMQFTEKQPIVSVLECLQKLNSSILARSSICSEKWIELLRSSLATILDVCKTIVWNLRHYGEEPKPNEITAISVIEIFILKAPQKVIRVPNLQYPCINLLQQSLQSQREMVQLRCLQTLKMIFAHEDYSVKIPYIHAIAPRLIEMLGHLVNECCLQNTEPSKLKHDIIVSGLEAFEALINAAQNDKKIRLLSLYLPTLVSILSDNINMMKGKTNRILLHKYALQKLTTIGTIYHQEFRQIIGQVSHFRKKLETAIRNQQELGSNFSRPASNRVDTQQEYNAIKLKTDFSNYVDKI